MSPSSILSCIPLEASSKWFVHFGFRGGSVSRLMEERRIPVVKNLTHKLVHIHKKKEGFYQLLTFYSVAKNNEIFAYIYRTLEKF